jgi:hypothetical protein
VEASQQLVAGLIVFVLLGISAYFIWRQKHVLRSLRENDNLPPEDRRYLRSMAWRRLIGSGLMVVLAALLTGWFLMGLGERANELGRQGDAMRARGEEPILDAEQLLFIRLSTSYVITILLVLLSILCLAAADLWAIHRFGSRHRRQIQADRREMIERQVARLRSERNGHS